MVEPEDVEFDNGNVRDVNPVVVVRDSVYHDVIVWNALVSLGSYEFPDVFIRWEGQFCYLRDLLGEGCGWSGVVGVLSGRDWGDLCFGEKGGG